MSAETISHSAIFFSVISIIILDLVLSGDNAAVIGMAIYRLPKNIRRKAAIYGTFFAIILRIIFTAITAVILNIPYLRFCGGVLLILITYRLVKNSPEESKFIPAKKSFYQAIGIIVLADLSMAFDNVLAVAGAAQGHLLLVVFGLMFSMPVLIFASTWLSGIMSRYPLILWLGAAVLVNTSVEMILTDKNIDFAGRFGIPEQYISIAAAVIFFSYNTWKQQKQK